MGFVMTNPEAQFHFPTDIHLERKPLAEAWLELQWRTEHNQPPAPALIPSEDDVDTYYPLALGAFFQNIRHDYPVQEALPASILPDNAFPNTIRHRFRTGADQWPVLQIGPGVATVNVVEPYTWQLFRKQALFLRRSLLSAYGGVELQPTAVILRYRNAFPFDYHTGNVLEYLGQNLNLKVVGSQHIPGAIGDGPGPAEFSLNLGYLLSKPEAIGNIRVATAMQTNSDNEVKRVLIADLEVRGRNDGVNVVLHEDGFSTWLDEAHAVIHEWFFALIDGSLREGFEHAI